MFIIVLGQHVSILIESSSDPSKNTDPYLAMFKMRCGTYKYVKQFGMSNIRYIIAVQIAFTIHFHCYIKCNCNIEFMNNKLQDHFDQSDYKEISFECECFKNVYLILFVVHALQRQRKYVCVCVCVCVCHSQNFYFSKFYSL